MTVVTRRRAAARTRRPLLASVLLAASASCLGRPAQAADHHTHRALPAHTAAAGHAGHAGHTKHAAGHADAPAVAEFKAVHASMMRGMDVPYTGDPDVDFRLQMIPHHQGAIDMAGVAMRRARDPWTRQLAEAVIVEQQREIAEMTAWLAKRGVAAPGGGAPQHRITASSYRRLEDEPGTREEAGGRSWSPGAGVPIQR